MSKYFCMFVSSIQLRRNPRLHFFNDKELPAKGSKSERLVNPVLNCIDNPKVGNSAYKTFSIMSIENNFVTDSTYAKVTPTQQNSNSTFFKLKGIKIIRMDDNLLIFSNRIISDNFILQEVKKEFGNINYTTEEYEVRSAEIPHLHQIKYYQYEIKTNLKSVA